MLKNVLLIHFSILMVTDFEDKPGTSFRPPQARPPFGFAHIS